MQVPERLALIGGSILLSSTLVFTLKSQASNITPKISDAVHAVMQGDRSNNDGSSSHQLSEDEQKQRQEEQQKSQEESTKQRAQERKERFQNDLADAKQQGLPTGQWGTADYYIDSNDQMHIGGGQLQGSLSSVLGKKATALTSIDFTEPVQAPSESSYLLSTATWYSDKDSQLASIQNLNNLDTSQATDMSYFFYNNSRLQSLDASSLNTSRATQINGIFSENVSLTDLNVSGWDVRNVIDSSCAFNYTGLVNLDLSSWHTNPSINILAMFANSPSLQGLNIMNFDTSQSSTTQDMYSGSSQLRQITQGENTRLSNTGIFDSSWINGENMLSSYHLNDGNGYPGTWDRQQ